MDLDYIAKTFLETLKGVPTTLIIMIVAMVLSFLPALFLALGQIYKVKGVRTFSYKSNTSDFADSFLL